LCAAHGVLRLELFGSAAREDFDPAGSDFDFLVEFGESSPAAHADAYFGLLEALERLFSRSVDLVERRAIRNPFFLGTVERTRVTVYAAA
jgi:hypothetical protein